MTAHFLSFFLVFARILQQGDSMLKYIWAFLIVAGLITGIAAGNGEAVSAAVTDGAKTAAELCLSMLGAYALYMGLLGVLDDAGA